MTTINWLGASSVQFPQRPSGPPPAPPKMSGTAQLLGMSADELREAQASGTTLASLAEAKGVSRSDLTASIAADLEADKPEGAPELTEVQLAEMAQGIAEGRGRQGPPPPGGPGGLARQSGDRAPDNLAALAESLGTDAESLLAQLQSGADLAELVRSSTVTGYGSSPAAVTGGLTVDRYA